ncbi:hypothetical protein FP744_10006351 [Trichoderma asperellum]|nr:NAD(P)-binding protein [Trichoderma asperelloides]
MAPIRVGIIGLGAIEPGLVAAGAWAASALLPSFLSSPHYELVAVCNSTVESARRSIEFHKLGSTVKAYGNPEDIANDPNVDLVAVSINVGKHYAVAKPALLAKKQVFVEWPLGANTTEAEELTKLAKDANLKTIIGTQFLADPAFAKVKELVDSGAIGKITSTEAQLSPNYGPPDVWGFDATYYLDLKSGGNEFHIAMAHFLAGFLHVLGDFATVKASFLTQYPTVKLLDTKTGQIVDPAYPRKAPDHMFVQGVLNNGAIASVNYRRNPQLVGKPTRWVITGTEGEIEFTVDGPMLQMGSHPREIRIKTAKEENGARVVAWGEGTPAHVEGVAFPGQNTAYLFEDFAVSKEGAPDFEDALRLHKLLDRILKDANPKYD